jgi:hypothetical protein
VHRILRWDEEFLFVLLEGLDDVVLGGIRAGLENEGNMVAVGVFAHASPSTCMVLSSSQHGGLAAGFRVDWLRLNTPFTSSETKSKVEGL